MYTGRNKMVVEQIFVGEKEWSVMDNYTGKCEKQADFKVVQQSMCIFHANVPCRYPSLQ